MAKQISTSVVESVQTLEKLFRQQTKLLQLNRVKALLLIKQGKVRYTYELSAKVGYSRKTVYNWLKLYEQKGIEAYLAVSSRGKRRDKLSDATKGALGKKLSDSHSTITSYVELQAWVAMHCQQEVGYHVIYNYCRSKLKSRLKVARKSHYKKDEETIVAFKKTSKSI